MGRHRLQFCGGRSHILHHRLDHGSHMGKTCLECLVDVGSQINNNVDTLVHLCGLHHLQGRCFGKPTVKSFCRLWNHRFCQCAHYILRHQIMENHTPGRDHHKRHEHFNPDEPDINSDIYRLLPSFLHAALRQNPIREDEGGH